MLTKEFLMTAFNGDKEAIILFLIAQHNKGNITDQEGSDLGDEIMSEESTASIGCVKAEDPPEEEEEPLEEQEHLKQQEESL